MIQFSVYKSFTSWNASIPMYFGIFPISTFSLIFMCIKNNDKSVLYSQPHSLQFLRVFPCTEILSQLNVIFPFVFVFKHTEHMKCYLYVHVSQNIYRSVDNNWEPTFLKKIVNSPHNSSSNMSEASGFHLLTMLGFCLGRPSLGIVHVALSQRVYA